MIIPDVEIYHHCRLALCDAQFEQRLLDATHQCVRQILTSIPQSVDHVLSDLGMVEISLVDDAIISDIHGRFLDDPTPTDVITFPYGEIIISVTTAQRHALSHNEPADRELFRYIVHGLLHLHGYLDATEEQRRCMFAFQEPLVSQYWA